MTAIDAAAALRRLATALLVHEADDEALAKVTAHAGALAQSIESAPRRAPEPNDLSIPLDGGAVEHPARCPISGPANPFAPGLIARRVGDEIVCEVTMTAASEGYPGRAHGGVVAALFDDATAFATRLTGHQCVAVDLRVTYRAPVPIGVPVEIRAWVAARDGRKIHTKAVATVSGRVVAEATCLKLVVDNSAAPPGDS